MRSSRRPAGHSQPREPVETYVTDYRSSGNLDPGVRVDAPVAARNPDLKGRFDSRLRQQSLRHERLRKTGGARYEAAD